MNARYFFVAGLVLMAVLARFIPHPQNFSPVGAVALFAGAHLWNRRVAFAVPLSAMLLSDLLVGVHLLMPFVYGSFAITVGLGFALKKRPGAATTAFAAFLSAGLFYLITNFGVWLCLDTFPKTGPGLIACYLAGIPHFQNTLLSDLFYAFLLFGGVALAERRYPILRPVEARIAA